MKMALSQDYSRRSYMAQLIDGKLISTQIKDELKAEVATLKEKHGN